MGQERLSALALMTIEQDVTSKLMEPKELDDCVEKFASLAERRLITY